MSTFNPSPHQLAFRDELVSGSRSICLKAVAGSGKTTTIVWASQFIDPFRLTYFLAFNKRIVEELKDRLPSHVRCSTFHSLGLNALSRALPRRPRVSFDKLRDIMKKELKGKDLLLYGQFISRLIGYAKNFGLGTELMEDETSSWRNLISHFGLTGDSLEFDEDEALRLTKRVFDASVSDTSVVDGDDMLYLALRLGCRFDLANFVFVDEAQDTNAVQGALLKRMLAPGGRVIIVGDDKQAIYGFRGAGGNALKQLVEDFDAVELPLSTCYRCSKAVIRETVASVKGTSIRAADDAPEGSVRTLSEYEPSSFAADAAILCRNAAPLVSFAFALIKRNVGCKVLGREIGSGLVTLVKKLNAVDLDDLAKRLEMFEKREREKFLRKGDEQGAENVTDRVACIELFISHSASINELTMRIADLFDDSSRGLLTLATVHKAKGLEWPTVFLLDKDKLMPSKFARKPWQVEQEWNLIYVAQTRAKLDLRYISGGSWKKTSAQAPSNPLANLANED